MEKIETNLHFDGEIWQVRVTYFNTLILFVLFLKSYMNNIEQYSFKCVRILSNPGPSRSKLSSA